jgi:hypothetical protein
MAADTTKSRTEEEMIERDIERTQDEMGATVQKLEGSLNPKDVARSVVGDEGVDFAKEAVELARQNPVPVAMIAVGAIWLLATARTPGMQRITDKLWSRRKSSGLRPRSAEPAPIGPPPTTRGDLDRRPL